MNLKIINKEELLKKNLTISLLKQKSLNNSLQRI